MSLEFPRIKAGRERNRLHAGAARGEAEAAQLVLRPDANLQQLTVAASALEGPGGARLPAEQVDLLRVGYVAVERPSDPSGAAAPWPDPLLPLTGAITVAAGTNQPARSHSRRRARCPLIQRNRLCPLIAGWYLSIRCPWQSIRSAT